MNTKKNTQIIIRPLGAFVLLGAVTALTVMALRPQSALAGKGVRLSPNTPAVAKKTATASTLANGTMEDSNDADLSGTWPYFWCGAGRAQARRDTVVVHSGKGALRLESLDGKSAHASISHPMSTAPGQTIHVKGFGRSEGKFQQASVAVQVFKEENGTRKQTGWIDLGNLVQSQDGWQEFDRTVTMPKENHYAQIVLSLDGNGKVWLDDLEAEVVAKP